MAAILRAVDVFTPSGLPTVTYVERRDQNLEDQLRNAVKTPGLVVSLSGPSKSGKSVLVHRVLPRDQLITVPGAAVKSADDLWDRVLDWMQAPSETNETTVNTVGAQLGGKLSGKAGIPMLASAEAEGSIAGSGQHSRSTSRKYSRGGLAQVIREIAGSDFVVFIDDFHYMGQDTQVETAKQIKAAAEAGVRICTASVPHRADDVVRGNTELRGRVKGIDFKYWDPNDIAQIAVKGFNALGVQIGPKPIEQFAREVFGSPQLMQAICLQTCFYYKIEHTQKPAYAPVLESPDLRRIFEQTSTLTDFSSLLDSLHSGPRTRGQERNQFEFVDDSRGDVYRCILLALKQDPPRLAFPYDEIYQRTRNVCVTDAPAGSSVSQALEQMQTITETVQPTSRVLEWSEDVLDIVDPYFLYYVRCSSRLGTIQKARAGERGLFG